MPAAAVCAVLNALALGQLIDGNFAVRLDFARHGTLIHEILSLRGRVWKYQDDLSIA